MGEIVMLNQHDGRRAFDGRERFRMFPKGLLGTYRLYALGYADGRTKIGKCSEPRTRIAHHWVASEGALTWVHLFAETFAANRHCEVVERDAMNRAARVGKRIRRTETFRELSRDQAIACVRAAIRADQD